MTETPPKPNSKRTRLTRELFVDLLLILILIAAAYLRFTGIDWGEGAFLHPDEAFLANVETSLSPVSSLREYWNTAESTLNPQNTGYEFYVYGTLPIFLARYTATMLSEFDWGGVMVVGRTLSAVADVATVFVVFLTAERLFDRRVGVVAAAFSAFSVLPIQLSHYSAVDTFQTLFILLTVYFGVCLAQEKSPTEDRHFRPRYFILFGIAFGLSFASKIHIPPVALVILLAVWIRIANVEREQRWDAFWEATGYLVLAGVVSFLTFRVFQPYAFKGPGFFGMLPNTLWVDKLMELFRQQTGDFDWPPSIQWARIPIYYSFQHMVLWGMGLPMSIAAWGGFLWAGWKMLTGRWKKFIILWGWTALYFGYQSSKFNPTMRYQIPVYPMLAIFAGWAVVELWDSAGMAKRARGLLRTAAVVIGGAALVLTALYAFAFVTIYERPITRLEASRWVYQNIPGPLNLQIETGEGMTQEPLPLPYTNVIAEGSPFTTSFSPQTSGVVEEITYKTVKPSSSDISMYLWISPADMLDTPLYTTQKQVSLGAAEEATEVAVPIETSPVLLAGRQYLLRLDVLTPDAEVTVNGGFFVYMFMEGERSTPMLLEGVKTASAAAPFELTFTPPENVTLSQLSLTLQLVLNSQPDEQTLQLTFATTPDFLEVAATAEAVVDVSDGANTEGGVFVLNQPVMVEEGVIYYLKLDNLTPGGQVTLTGSAIANETSWDPGLPYSLDGYSGFNGTYLREMEFQLTDDGSPEKLARMLDILGRAEYIAISSSRQWASTTRIPERFPINMLYYRYLMGCPEDLSIQACYNKAQVGMYEGQLGFELVQVFQSNPTFGPIEINDQASDEAFTVYDHPKVFV
ncbi:MAG TPA: glycosyltransferase family 39 protein, partial [Anaerolineales bacterium]|nr:glycosyltransferase family 39 protein [Anaerolineales bacterium]